MKNNSDDRKYNLVETILLTLKRGDNVFIPQKHEGSAFAPSNIALCKYWGKRDAELNLPMTNSLSVSLNHLGATTTITPDDKDFIFLNNTEIKSDTAFAKRLLEFINLFRKPNQFFHFNITSNLPIAAGFASSAAGFASLILAIDDLFQWQLTRESLSILARLGSGSAARSLWQGFVEWEAGIRRDGLDSFGVPLKEKWPNLYLGILKINENEKTISSRLAMQRTVDSSLLYQLWPKKCTHDLPLIKTAIEKRNFPLLGGTAESNAMTMHATMLSSWPPICYFLPETVAAMHKIWQLRKEGLEVYFTQDAGPNLKLLFESQNKQDILLNFPDLHCIELFPR